MTMGCTGHITTHHQEGASLVQHGSGCYGTVQLQRGDNTLKRWAAILQEALYTLIGSFIQCVWEPRGGSRSGPTDHHSQWPTGELGVSYLGNSGLWGCRSCYPHGVHSWQKTPKGSYWAIHYSCHRGILDALWPKTSRWKKEPSPWQRYLNLMNRRVLGCFHTMGVRGNVCGSQLPGKLPSWRINSWGGGEFRWDGAGGKGWVPVVISRQMTAPGAIVLPTNSLLFLPGERGPWKPWRPGSVPGKTWSCQSCRCTA